MKGCDGSERLFEDSRDEALAAKETAKKIVRIGCVSSESGAVLYKRMLGRLYGDS